MGIKGKVREREFVKKTGFFEGEVIAINPSKEQLEKLLETTLEKEPEYITEDTDRNRKLNLVVWIRDVKVGDLRNIRFFLKDKERVSMDGTKKQYINNVGMTGWADDEANLPEWFTAREYRVAHEGEEELYNFVVTWLNDLDVRDPDTTISFDWKKLMAGDVTEIAEQIRGEFCKTVCCLVTMRTVNNQGEPVEYEQVYNKEFLPGFVMKQIRLRTINDSFIESAKNTDRNKRSKLQKFVLNIKHPKYGIKDFFTLGEVIPYDASQNIVSGNSVIEEDDTSY